MYNQPVSFAYTQIRLQAHNARRPVDLDWYKLTSLTNFDLCLQYARSSPFAYWVETISHHSTVHELEYLLREKWRFYVRQVSHWMPKIWQMATLWYGYWPELPKIVYHLRQLPGYPWLENGLFTQLDPRLAATQAIFLQQWQKNSSLLETAPIIPVWASCWQSLWPEQMNPIWQQTLTHLMQSVERLTTNKTLLTELDPLLRRSAQHYICQPAAIFIHLTAVGLDWYRLKGILSERRLFTTEEGGSKE